MADLRSQRFKQNPRLQAAANNSPAMHKDERDKAATRIIQEALVDLGLSMPLSTKTEPTLGVDVCDGIYGDETEKKVAEFQSRYELVKHDGIVGGETMSKLDALFLRPDSLIRKFLRIRKLPFGGRPLDFGQGLRFHIGGAFDVLAVFVKDALNQFKRLEYRQEIRGQTLVNGVRKDLIFIFPRWGIFGGGQPLLASPQEDGAKFVGPYGYRRGSGQENDRYFVLNPETLALLPDMLSGDVYHSFDFYGLHLTREDCAAYASKTVQLNLVFSGKIVECGTPGGASIRVVREISWPESGSFIVPPSF